MTHILTESNSENEPIEEEESISDREQVAEDFIKHAVKKVFTEGKLDQNESELLKDLLKVANGRYFFAKSLQSFKVNLRNFHEFFVS